ncbi:hypothetical protein C0Q70_11447 [Pomacea canaliculata]|uniref:Uncharacterized protein n=1 Tax=Pomacea canaliculata TaxID=400727 RepID=A0A2T7P5Z2_POMCA|nr:hypothetical protein C0Q70_11447 [Pomacea canaliculata]
MAADTHDPHAKRPRGPGQSCHHDLQLPAADTPVMTSLTWAPGLGVEVRRSSLLRRSNLVQSMHSLALETLVKVETSEGTVCVGFGDIPRKLWKTVRQRNVNTVNLPPAHRGPPRPTGPRSHLAAPPPASHANGASLAVAQWHAQDVTTHTQLPVYLAVYLGCHRVYRPFITAKIEVRSPFCSL